MVSRRKNTQSSSYDGLPAALRRDQMLAAIREREFVSVGDLSAAFTVSEVTVRADLDALHQLGVIQRIRGGAIHKAMPTLERSFEESTVNLGREKDRIGQAAAAMVSSGETVLLDVGTTTAAVARALAARTDLHDVYAFTNGLRIALELEEGIPNLIVIVTGGTLRRLQHSLVNPLGTVILGQIHAHIAFLACSGIDPAAGITHINVAEVEVKQLMMRAARKRVVVADGSKVGKVSLVHLFGVEDIDVLVTDQSADPAVLSAIRDRGVEVEVV